MIYFIKAKDTELNSKNSKIHYKQKGTRLFFELEAKLQQYLYLNNKKSEDNNQSHLRV